MRVCWGPSGHSIFHRWVEKDDGKIYALIENQTGECRLWSYDSIRFSNYADAYNRCISCGTDKMLFDFDKLRNVLIRSGAVTCISGDCEPVILDKETPDSYKIPKESVVRVDYNKLVKAVYDAGYRWVVNDEYSG